MPPEEKENWNKPDRPQPIVDHEKTQLSERFSEANYLRLEREHQRGCEAIQAFVARVKHLTGECEEAKRETRRSEKRLSETRAELKELRDAYNRAEWEARQLRADATGVPGTLADVRDMTEEENERLWAEVEDKNKKLAQMSLEMEKQIQALLTSLKEKETQLAECEAKLSDRDARVRELEEKMSQPLVTNNLATFNLPSGDVIEDLSLCLRRSLIDLHESRLWHRDGLRESLDHILSKGDAMFLGLGDRSVSLVLQQPAMDGGESNRLRESETARKNATNACALLVGRLEELAGFLVTLLHSPERLGDVDRLSISRAVQRSMDLSRQLSASVSDPVPAGSDDQGAPETLEEATRVIARLRARVEALGFELRQRDIELGCLVRENGLERSLLSPAMFVEGEGGSTDRAGPPSPLAGGPPHSPRDRGDATALSESETWSEPDRQISLARIGLEENVIRHNRSRTLPLEQEESSGSSQETARETRTPGKPRRDTMESRRLQARLRGLEQVNEALRTELAILHQASPVARMCSPDTPPGVAENPVFPSHLLEEIRRQREKLESSLLHNDLIRRQLEGAFLSATGDRPGESRLRVTEHGTAELEEKLREAETLLAERLDQAEKLAESERRCEELERKIGELEALIRERDAEIATREALVRERDAEIATKTVEIETKDALVREKEIEVAEKEDVIREKDHQIAKKEDEIATKEALLLEKDNKIAEKEGEIATKEALVQEKDNKIAEKEDEIATKEALVREKDNKIAEKEDEIATKEALVREKENEIATKDSIIVELEQRAEKQKAEIHRIVQEMTELKTESERRVTEAEKRLSEAKSVLLNKVEHIEREMASYKQRNRDAELALKEAKTSLNEALVQRSEANEVIETMKAEFSSRVRAYEETRRCLEAESSREVDRRSRKLEEAERQLEELRWAHETEVEAASRRARDEGALAASTAALEASRLANEKLRLEQRLRGLEADRTRERLEAERQIEELRRCETDLEARTRDLEAVNTELRARLERMWGGQSPPPTQHRPDARDNGYASGRGWTPDNPDSRSPLSSLVLQRGFGRQHSEFSDYVSEDADYETVVTRSCWITTVTNRGAHSPDLGIESDQGRLSSLETGGETAATLQTIRRGRSNHNCTAIEEKNFELKRELCQTRRALEDTLAQLTAANHRKQNVEKAICKQIEKTCSLLQETRGNLQPEHLMLCNDRT